MYLHKPSRSLILPRKGIGFAYKCIPKDQSRWWHIRGIWINTEHNQWWFTVER